MELMKGTSIGKKYIPDASYQPANAMVDVQKDESSPYTKATSETFTDENAASTTASARVQN